MESAVRRRACAVTALSAERLGVDDADALRAIRLEALRAHPEAFCSDPDVVEAFTREHWVDGLAKGTWFGVRKDGALVGIAAFTRPGSKKLSHTGELSAMYVRDDMRGKGAADALIRGIIGLAVSEVIQIKLTVNAGNARAVKLYERHGFRIVGRIPRVIRVGERLYDELVMIRTVSPSD